MEIHQAYKFELDLNDRERTALARGVGLARFVWNWGLAARKLDYETRIEPARERGEKPKSLSTFDQINAWNVAKGSIAPWASEQDTRIPEFALAALNGAYQAWWKGLREGRHVGAPRFKTRGQCRDSFRTRGSIKITETSIRLPRLGDLEIKGKASRVDGRILFATVSRTADRWLVSLTVSRTIVEPMAPVGPAIGIDLGISAFAVLSTGEMITSPRPLESAQRSLRRLNRALARSKRGSTRRAAIKVRLARKHARIANIRSTFIHQTTARLVREHAAIGIEDLATSNLIKNNKLARHISDQGWGEFRRQLTYKAAWKGVSLVVADRFYPSSQRCSTCGHRQAMPLSERQFTCHSCGLGLNRDLNAARNLKPVAVMPTETQNAHRGIVSPSSAWLIPQPRVIEKKCEPSSECQISLGAPLPQLAETTG